MMTAALLVNFFILAVIVGLVGLVLGLLIRRGLSVKINFIVIGCYLALLAILAGLCFIIPSGRLVAAADSEKTLRNFSNGESAIRQSIRDGSFDAPEDFYKEAYSFGGPAGDISIYADPQLYNTVYVGTKGVDAPDNGSAAIDVYSYIGGTANLSGNYYNILTNDHPLIGLQGKSLSITPAGEIRLDFYRFDDRDAVPYFFANGPTDYFFSGTRGFQCVIVLLPPGVSYTGDNTEPLSAFMKPGV
jgi:hypothetical protein